jgi:hypothetical protein
MSIEYGKTGIPGPAGSGGATAWGSITGTLSSQTDLSSALGTKVTANAGITPSTKTKLTYDAKGLVTVGADATTADIDVSSDKNYVDDGQLIALGNFNHPAHYLVAAGTSIQAVIDLAVAAGHTQANPAWVVMQEARTENLVLAPGVYLLGRDSSGTHCPIVLTGSVTVSATSGAITANRYAIEGVMVSGPSGGNAVLFSGTAPARLFLRDVWLAGAGAGFALETTNTGSGSIVDGNTVKLSHSGTGWLLHCAGCTTTLRDVETSGNVGVGHVETGGSLYVDGGECDANATSVFDVEAAGVLTLTRSQVTNALANSNGIRLLGVAASAYALGCAFSVPAGSGMAVTGGAGMGLWYQYLVFAPSTNTTINPAITSVALAALPSNSGDVSFTAVGASPSAAGATVSAVQAITLQPADATHPGLVTTDGQTFTGAKRVTEVVLTSTSASIAINLDLATEFSHTTTENTTLAAPSHPVAGQTGSIAITQGASPMTLDFDHFWKFPAGVVPTLTATLGAVDLLTYRVLPGAASAFCQLFKDGK